MYERSAIVLERYLNKIFGQDETNNIKSTYKIYKDILDEMEKYQVITEEEEKVIDEFDEIAKKMQLIQKKQEALCSDSIEQEEERNKLFNDFDQDPNIIEKKLLKIEQALEENEEEQRNLREEYIDFLNKFSEKQRERNKCSKNRRLMETSHIKILNETIEKIEAIDLETVKKVKEFINTEDIALCKSLSKIMLENGKDEKIKFDKNVINKSVQTRIEIAKKEAECYLTCYVRLKKLMTEIESDNIKLEKYQKTAKDITVKLNFLEAEKSYIVSFLDNERMTTINGDKIHNQMMQEACKNFDLDMAQINNLYELILREIAGKSTKKAYKELYNSTYLTDIEEKEKTFNQEVNNIKANIGTIINTNYWRIEGIKNIYEVFNNEIEEQYGRDLSEFMPQKQEEYEEYEEQEDKEEFIEKQEKPKIIELYQQVGNSKEENEEEWYISNNELEEINENSNRQYNKNDYYDDEDEENYDDDEDYYNEDEDEDEYYDEDEEEYEEDEDYYDEEEEDYDDDYAEDETEEDLENEEDTEEDSEDEKEKQKIKNKTKEKKEKNTDKKSSLLERIFKEKKK